MGCGRQTIRYIFGEQFSPACFSLLYNYKTVLFSSKNRFPFAWICIRCQSDSKDLQIRQEIYPTFVRVYTGDDVQHASPKGARCTVL